ncbi:MAG: AAA family ATPase, partial [Deltaproteobacteria bacterium]|nr:AAA family ATPase [Deltaproteobacteria bacterium]
MRFTQVELAGFRGHVLTLDLPAAGIISGLNGTGKTSIAQAILLATTQQVPGAMTDNEGVVATGPCLDWTGTTGRWGVTVHDSGGAQASFEFAADGDSGRRNVKLSGCDARKNSIVRQALVDRYGAPHVGPMLLDLEAMRAMAPDQLEKMILRLCGGVSEWTPKRLLNEVALGALSRAKQTSVDELALDLPALRARFSELGLAGGSEGDVRDVLLVLGITSKERQKAARSAVLATNPVLEAPTPDAPDTTTIAGLRQEAEAAQQAAYRASETVAAVRAELDRGREDIRRWERTRAERVRAAEGAVAEAQRRLDDVRRAYAAATEEERRGKERLEARRAEVGNLEAEMQRLAQQSGGEAAAAAARELAAARQELAQANAEIVAIEAGPEPMVSPEKLRELEAARAVHAESGAEYRGLTGELAAAKADQRVQQQQAAALESGICPTCGQTTHGVLEDMEEDFAAAARLVARIEQDLERTRKVGVAARETIALCEAAQQGAEKARSIRSAQIDRARANAHAAGDRVRQAERKTERLTRGGGEQQAALDSRAEGLRALI